MINLLPPEKKEKYILTSKAYTAALLYVSILVILGVGAAALGTFNLIQSDSVTAKNATLHDLKKKRDQHKDLITQLAFIEDRMRAAKTYQETSKHEEVLNYVASSTPSDVQITGLSVTASDASQLTQITIDGTAQDRRSIILFKDKLSEVTQLEPAVVTNIVEQSNGSAKTFTFNITTRVKKDVAKK